MLTAEQQRQYRDDGYTIADGIFTTPELDVMEREFDGILERRLREKAKLDATWRGDWKKDMPPQVLLHTHDVQAYSAAWTRVLAHARFTEAMSDVVGPNVQLHHTKAFLKPPEKGAAFPMHQDYPYFPHTKHSMGAAIIHLSDATEEMGCFSVYPGSHKGGPLACATPDVLYLDPVQYPIEKATRLPAKRGDVVFFNYLLIHGSDINRSSQPRKTVLVQYRDPTDMPLAKVHLSHAQGMILHGIDPLEGRHTAGGVLDAVK